MHCRIWDTKPLQFSEIIDLWPSRRALWRDLKESYPDLAYDTVKSWRSRNSISSEYFDAIVLAAKANGYKGVTHEALCHAAAKPVQARKEPEPAVSEAA